ncbi:MAG: hypothetical protein E6G64_16020 [Actinobacteria bacterium]|nr:MAG: hypothetical protein E6G64_16020 [Actinomycetota bacterium]
MPDSVHPLTLELLAWISDRPRTYNETIEAWRSNCPRHPAWDDALGDGLVQVSASGVALTARGRDALPARLAESRPSP